MRETTKSNRVRRKTNELYRRVFWGAVLDVGCGDDPISATDFPGIVSVKTFDTQDGDANVISKYFAPSSFDVIYGSQVLEHLFDPLNVVKQFTSLVKVGGYIVMSIPHWYLYEQGNWPSKWNPDHKSTWGITKPQTPRGVGVVEMLMMIPGLEIILVQLCDTNYDRSKIGTGVDQTLQEADGVEAWVEFVVRRVK